MKAWKNAALKLAISLMAFPPSGPVHAAITQTVNYQGFLLSKVTNLPVETPQAIKFVIYDSAAGGTARFTESRCKVAVNKGRYDVEIGSSIAGGLPVQLFLDYPNLWLEIQLAADGNCAGSYEAMSPRVRLQASPYAFNALYASTAAAGAPVFSADIIGAYPETLNGAVTISTNLFVQGGISVGAISPGQKLSVAGMVESSAGGFKFPDGSVQVKAAADTLWEAGGENMYSINAGNVGVGESVPLARLHVSTGAGAAGNILILSTGASAMFRVNGLGQVYGSSYHGDGTTLNGILLKAGDTMTGQLTLAGSSLTVASPAGISSPRIRLASNVELSSAAAAGYGGVFISTNISIAGKYYGDGSGLSSVTSSDPSKVLKAGDTMTGQLTLSNSTLTVTGAAFSVAGSAFSVLGGNTAVGSASYLALLTVGGGVVATSSVTAQGGFYSPRANISQNLTASSGTFTASGAAQYSLETSSGILVNSGTVFAPSFAGDGRLLANVSGTDASRVLKTGDTMTGNLLVSGSSVTVAAFGAHTYALTVGSAAAVNNYALAVTTAGYVGVQVLNPSAPLEVGGKVLVSYPPAGDSQLHLYSNSNYNYLHWSDYGLTLTPGGANQGVLGFPAGSRDLVYRANGADPGSGGAEVFRIKSDDSAFWKFGIGTANPAERLHIAANVLVSTPASAAPILYISTASGRIAIGTNAQTHNLMVGGGVLSASSITALGGFFGNGAGITGISAANLPQELKIATITAAAGALYDGVVFTTHVYAASALSAGELFTPQAELHVRGLTRLDQHPGGSVILNFFPNTGGDSYIKWEEGSTPSQGTLGILGGTRELTYHASASTLVDGYEAFRIKADGKFGIGTQSPSARFQVTGNFLVGTSTGPWLYSPVGSGYVGISTGAPKERLHVGSSFLVGADRSSAILYVSTASSFAGIGTGNPRALLEVGDGNLLAAGTYTGTQSLPLTGAGARLMWIPSVSAFRAGEVASAEWDSIGLYSVAFSQNNAASASYSAVLGGYGNTNQGNTSTIAGGNENFIGGQRSVVPGGMYNIVMSSYAFAGGRKNYLDTTAEGTFVWGYNDSAGNGFFNNPPVTASYAFLIDPADVKHYKTGIRTSSPQAALDVNGDAQFGAGTAKSTFTAEGFWLPRSMTTAQLHAAGGTPPAVGAVVFNSNLKDLCVSTGTAVGQWARVGSGGTGMCF